MDFFKLKDGKIVEHWDALQAIPEKTASGQDMFSDLSAYTTKLAYLSGVLHGSNGSSFCKKYR